MLYELPPNRPQPPPQQPTVPLPANDCLQAWRRLRKLNRTQRGILEVLSDGRAHKRRDFYPLLNQGRNGRPPKTSEPIEHPAVWQGSAMQRANNTIKQNVSTIRRKLRKVQQDIVLVHIPGSQRSAVGYRLVGLLRA